MKYSMAGVFESFLNIKSYDELEYSIKNCYASLFSDKALSLMLRNNIKFEDIGMSVIVQRFVEGDVSGVMFTADTISMDRPPRV
jgi:pyruvate,water dikinase